MYMGCAFQDFHRIGGLVKGFGKECVRSSVSGSVFERSSYTLGSQQKKFVSHLTGHDSVNACDMLSSIQVRPLPPFFAIWREGGRGGGDYPLFSLLTQVHC